MSVGSLFTVARATRRWLWRHLRGRAAWRGGVEQGRQAVERLLESAPLPARLESVRGPHRIASGTLWQNMLRALGLECAGN